MNGYGYAGLGTAAAVLAVYLALTLGLSGKEAAGKAAAERKRQVPRPVCSRSQDLFHNMGCPAIRWP